MMINAKLNYTAQKMLWTEAVNMCDRVRNSMANTGSTKSTFKNIYGENRRSLVRSRSLDVLDTSLNDT